MSSNSKHISKDRVVKAIHLEEADRVPFDYDANMGIDARLKEHFGLQPTDHEGLLEALGVDFRRTWAPYNGPQIHPQVPDRQVDPEWGIHTRWIEHESGGYWDFCDFPLQDATEEIMEKWPMPNPDHYDYELALELCKRFEGYGICVGNPGVGDIMNSSGMLRNYEQVMVDLALQEPAWLTLIDRKLNVQLQHYERLLEKTRGYIDLFWIGEDLGSQHAPLISMKQYREVLKPRHQKLIDLAKSYDLPVMIHSCGSSSWVFNELIEMGVNVIDTLQPEAKDMSPSYLKETYGDRLAFHGAISTAGPLAYGTAEDVTNVVRETLEIMKPGGGYCMAPSHAIQDNTPTENVLAMYQAGVQFGTY